MGGAVPPLPNTPSWRGTQLGEAEGQLYLCLYLLSLLSLVFLHSFKVQISQPYKSDGVAEMRYAFDGDCLLKIPCEVLIEFHLITDQEK